MSSSASTSSGSGREHLGDDDDCAECGPEAMAVSRYVLQRRPVKWEEEK
jgi:hypothetical protein